MKKSGCVFGIVTSLTKEIDAWSGPPAPPWPHADRLMPRETRARRETTIVVTQGTRSVEIAVPSYEGGTVFDHLRAVSERAAVEGVTVVTPEDAHAALDDSDEVRAL